MSVPPGDNQGSFDIKSAGKPGGEETTGGEHTAWQSEHPFHRPTDRLATGPVGTPEVQVRTPVYINPAILAAADGSVPRTADAVNIQNYLADSLRTRCWGAPDFNSLDPSQIVAQAGQRQQQWLREQQPNYLVSNGLAPREAPPPFYAKPPVTYSPDTSFAAYQQQRQRNQIIG